MRIEDRKGGSSVSGTIESEGQLQARMWHLGESNKHKGPTPIVTIMVPISRELE